MTNHADLIARLRKSPADTLQEFTAFVASYTGRDTAYHERNQTTGLAFARACWDAAFSTIANEAADALNELAAEVERLSAQLAKVNARCDHLGMRLGEIIKERDDALRGWLLVADIRAAVGDNGTRMQPELIAYLREMRADAERYRWLAAHCRSTTEHWGGRWSIVIEGPPPNKHDEEDSFHAAIDAAMQK